MKNFRIAIVGAGVWGDTHAAIYREHPNVEPVAICDKNVERAKARAEKYGLQTEVLHADDYTVPTDIHGEAFRLVQKTVNDTFPGCAGSPYVMTGATDSRFYQDICDNVVRFAPVIYGPEQMKGMHGLNENIEISCLPGAVDFYRNLIRANVT